MKTAAPFFGLLFFIGTTLWLSVVDELDMRKSVYEYVQVHCKLNESDTDITQSIIDSMYYRNYGIFATLQLEDGVVIARGGIFRTHVLDTPETRKRLSEICRTTQRNSGNMIRDGTEKPWHFDSVD